MNIFIGSAAVHGVLMMALLFEPTELSALSTDLFDAPDHIVHWCCGLRLYGPTPLRRVHVVELVENVSPMSDEVWTAAERALREAQPALRQCAKGAQLPLFGTVELSWVVQPDGRSVSVGRNNLPVPIAECMAKAIELRPWWPEREHVIDLELHVLSHWAPIPAR